MSNSTQDTVAVVDLSELTDQDWNEIRVIAIRVYSEADPKIDQMRASVIAFLEWLDVNQAKQSLYDERDNKKVH